MKGAVNNADGHDARTDHEFNANAFSTFIAQNYGAK